MYQRPVLHMIWDFVVMKDENAQQCSVGENARYITRTRYILVPVRKVA
jgi:hypothetical protein